MGDEFSIDKVKYKVLTLGSDNTAEAFGFDTGIINAVIGPAVVHDGKTFAVTSVGDDAFADCATLVSVSVKGGVTSVGAYAFSGCTRLSSLDLAGASNLASIEIGAFRGCSSVPSVTVPAKVVTIGNLAFEGCGMLTNIKFLGASAPTFGSKCLSLGSSGSAVEAVAHSPFADPKLNAAVLGDFTTIVFERIAVPDVEPEPSSGGDSTALIVGAVAVAGIGAAGAGVWFLRFRKP